MIQSYSFITDILATLVIHYMLCTKGLVKFEKFHFLESFTP